MPYIITTLHPWADANEPARRARTRRAVATLDEAREEAWRLAGWTPEAPESVRDMRRSHDGFKETTGGTIGPLPDGTVIEVEHVAYNWVAGVAEDNGAELSEDASCAEILDAYNAEGSNR